MATQTRTIGAFDYDWEYSSRVSVLFGIFGVVAVVGWLVSIMLTAIHMFAIPAIPADAPVQGSIEVITSQWAYVFGIPLATLGGVYYLGTLGLTLWWFDTRHPLIIKILTPITASGVAFSAYFVYLQLVPIGEICPFCMVSASATVILFGLELAILSKSSTPGLSEMSSDLPRLIGETNLAIIAFPMLIGAMTILGMFVVPMLPLPDVVPF
ncbi:vitamin K epoxide reductase family protein [Natranaeroarchaeum aerophilus]|uniref:Vitamin K epoxide reductase family protein n=1 Tax=Natranaeroarchaeum aerophilus TaxID=2917711 RepID=A0AAE3FP51_9EURY|nr:vitamin K epoxide reductase family protein [Natranaeroarchaeum aerophilus]MCL9812664.1 vitamin K epoxide reductase family protein [Natranaeroarchaeum aerophilus]